MKAINFILINLFLFSGTLMAGESLFGVNKGSIGMLTTPYSAPGMGRSYEIATTDSTQANYLNYAQWPEITFTSYSVKFNYAGAYGSNSTQNDLYNSAASFSGAYIVFPLMKKRLGFGVGLSPFTNMEIRHREMQADSSFLDEVVKGGTSRLMANVSVKILQNFNIALGYEYYFGNVSKNFRNENENNDYDALSFKSDYRMNGNGIVFSANYKPLDRLNFGLVYRPQVKITNTVKPETNSESVNDASEELKITIPSQIALGAEYKLSERWFSGLDFIYQDWNKDYKVDYENGNSGISSDSYAQYTYLGFGFERKHSYKLFTSFLEKMDYRFGFYYRQLSQTSNNNPVPEYAVSAGFSMPLQRFRSKIDFAGIIGSRGNLDNNNYEETFFKIGLSVSAMETWFVKIRD